MSPSFTIDRDSHGRNGERTLERNSVGSYNHTSSRTDAVNSLDSHKGKVVLIYENIFLSFQVLLSVIAIPICKVPEINLLLL